MTYTIPRNLFDILVEVFHSKEKAEVFANTFEEIVIDVKTTVHENTEKKQEQVKVELYKDLKGELATKEFVRAEIAETKTELKMEILEVKSEVKEIKSMLKILIALSIFGLTLLNPTFVKIIEKIF